MTALIPNISAEPCGPASANRDHWVVQMAGHELHVSPTRAGAINVACAARASIPGLQALVASRVESMAQTVGRLAQERRVDDALEVAGRIHALAIAYRAAVTRANRELDSLRAVDGGRTVAQLQREVQEDRMPWRAASLAAVPPAWQPGQPEPPEAA